VDILLTFKIPDQDVTYAVVNKKLNKQESTQDKSCHQDQQALSEAAAACQQEFDIDIDEETGNPYATVKEKPESQPQIDPAFIPGTGPYEAVNFPSRAPSDPLSTTYTWQDDSIPWCASEAVDSITEQEVGQESEQETAMNDEDDPGYASIGRLC
jgi:hypothetical protein